MTLIKWRKKVNFDIFKHIFLVIFGSNFQVEVGEVKCIIICLTVMS